METLIQGNNQQHIPLVCQILQEKLKRPTRDHPPPTPSKAESKCSVLAPEQRKRILTLARSIKKRKIDTKPTKKSEPTTSETLSKHKSPVESKDLPPDTTFSNETRPSEDTDRGPS